LPRLNYLSRGAKLFLLIAFSLVIFAGVASALFVDPNSDNGARLANAAGAITNVAALAALLYAAWSELTGYLRARNRDGGVLDRGAVTRMGESQSSVMPTTTTHGRPTVVIDGVELERIDIGEVPMGVIGDLTSGWKDDPLKTTRWAVGDIEWVLRKAGPDNYPWIVKFQNDDEHVFRISYGDHGRVGQVTISEFEAPNSGQIAEQAAD